MVGLSTERCTGFATRHPHHVNLTADKVSYAQSNEPQEQQQRQKSSSSRSLMSNIQGFLSSIATDLQEEEVMDDTNSEYYDLDRNSCSLPSQTRRPSLPCFDSMFRKDALQRSQSAGASASTTPSRSNQYPKRRGSLNPATLSDEEFITLKKQLASSKYVTTAGMRHALASSKPPSCSSLSSASSSSSTTEDNQHNNAIYSLQLAPALTHGIHKITSSLKNEEVVDSAEENDTKTSLVSEKESCILATHGALSSREHDSLKLMDFESWNESPLRKSMATTTTRRCSTLLEEEEELSERS